MTKHIRVDTFKVFSEEAEILSQIMKDHKLPPKTGRSKAYRIALNKYSEAKEICQELNSQKAAFTATQAQQEELYFALQALSNLATEFQTLQASVMEMKAMLGKVGGAL